MLSNFRVSSLILRFSITDEKRCLVYQCGTRPVECCFYSPRHSDHCDLVEFFLHREKIPNYFT
jgi:hypothetical protein